MDIVLGARLLMRTHALEQREHWRPEQIAAHQALELGKLREFAVQHSPFYQKFHSGLGDRPLSELPVLTKSQLMAEFDDVVTDRAITLADVRDFIAAEAGEFYRGRYRICATSGTSGHPGIFLFDPDEWGWVLASFARTNRLAGVSAGLLHHLRLAIVGSDRRWHQSNAVAESLECSWVSAIRLSATDPLEEICSRLTQWKPNLLITYSAVSGMLAQEQRAGRLDIAPKAIICIAETMLAGARAQVRDAWGINPFENYATTEAACIAAECGAHNGLHLFEDMLVVEIVDDQGKPVPAGTMGSRVLVTVLNSRTLPLIRYELDDMVMLADGDCECGLPFRRIAKIGGRIAETLRIRRSDGTVATIHPTHLEEAIGLTNVRGWQAFRLREGLRVSLLGPVAPEARAAVEANLRVLSSNLGLDDLHVEVEVVDELKRAPSGKMLLVRDASADASLSLT